MRRRQLSRVSSKTSGLGGNGRQLLIALFKVATLLLGLACLLPWCSCGPNGPFGGNSFEVTTLTLNPTTVIGGEANSTATVTINQAPDIGDSVTVTLVCPAKMCPASVDIGPNTATATFTVTTAAVTATTKVTVGAYVGITSQVNATLTVNPPSGPTSILSITKSHSGNFTQGKTGQYTVTVSNDSSAGATSGTVTVTENPPSGLTVASMSGTGWTCASGGTTCTRNDSLGTGGSYPAITVTINVAANASSPLTNSVTVSGGGSPDATAADSTTIQASPPPGNQLPSIISISPNVIPQGSSAQTLTITGTNFNNFSEVNFGPPSGSTTLTINSGSTGTQISVTIPASLLIAPANVNVTVTNPPPGGGTSNSMPVTISPKLAQGTILDPGNITAIDDAGDAVVAADGRQGYVYVLNSGKWSLATVLTNPDSCIVLGCLPEGAVSAAISGDGATIVLGSCADDGCTGHGFVYEEPTGGWSTASNPMSPTAQLTPSNDATGLQVGASVAIDQFGFTVAVGAPCDWSTGFAAVCGYVYVFEKPGTNWTDSTQENARLQHANGTAGGEPTMGFSLAMDAAGATIVAGAPGIVHPSVLQGYAKGDVDVFIQTPQAWQTSFTPNFVLTPTDAAPGDLAGWSVGVSTDGSTVVTGALQHPAVCTTNPCSSIGPGAAYIFSINNSGETEAAELTASAGQQNVNGDEFGSAIGVSDNGTVVVGARDADASNNFGGVAFVFVWDSSQTGLQQLNALQALIASSGTDISGNTVTPSQQFGAQLAIPRPIFVNNQFNSGAGTLVIGGLATVGANLEVPTTYVF